MIGESPFSIGDWKDLGKIGNENVDFEHIEDEIDRDSVEKLLQKKCKNETRDRRSTFKSIFKLKGQIKLIQKMY